jgi:hypothetical protein
VLKWREDIENINKKYSSNHQAQKLLSDADVGLAPGPPVSIEHGGTATTIDFQSHPQRDWAGWAILACAVGFLVVLLLWLYFAPGSREAARSALIADARMSWLFFSPGLRGRSPPGILPPAIEAVSSATPNGTMPRSETTSVHAYFILQNNETQGPYSIEELRSLWNNGTITGETFYCKQGYDEWLRLEKIVDCLQSASADRTSSEQSRTNLPAPLSPPAIPPVIAKKTLMQNKQVILIFGAVLFLVCGLCPPWVYVLTPEAGVRLEKDAGYGLIFAPPSPERHADKLAAAYNWSAIPAFVSR